MDKKIHPKVKEVMIGANIEAGIFGDTSIKPEHIVLAIISDNDNTASSIFKMLSINTDELSDSISDHLRSDVSIPKLSIRNNRDMLPLSNETKIIFKALDSQCERVDDSKIDTTHIILSILLTKTHLTKTLSDVGVTYTNFKQMIMNIKNDTPHEDLNNAHFESEDDSESYKRKGKSGDPKSKTPVLDNFCRDVSNSVKQGHIDAVVGRAKEIKRVTQILSRRKKNNPILIGEPGVGKTAIVEGLAQLIHDGGAPVTLMDKRIFTLDLASIVAGTKYRGQFEERMKAILEECKENPDIILFIDELHTIVGAGNASGSLDASNIFKPALARGELQVIGATTLDEYRENIEKDGALTRRFGQVIIEETNLEETNVILMNIKDKYEAHHKVKYTDEAIEECVRLADRYIMERAMPDKAIDVMDEVGASTNVSAEKPDSIKKLEEKLLGIDVEKREVVKKQKYEEAAKLRDVEREVTSQLDEAKAEWTSKLNKKVTIITPELVSSVVSAMSGIPLDKISTKKNKQLMNLDKDLIGSVIGQDDAVTKVVKAIKRNSLGIKDANKPIGSFIFLGPTGVGKTHLAKLLSKEVFGSEDDLVRVDMSEYMEKHTVSRLVGPPPGYVGYDQGGQLTEKVRRKPYCVILFDEIEKAHEDVFNILLQLLDEGHMTDGLGREVNFKNTLIILTSNVGVKELNLMGKGMGFETKNSIINEESRNRDIIDKALKKKFRPEFLNRIDEAIIFNTLSQDDINKIVGIELEKVKKRIELIGYSFTVTKDVMLFLGKEGYSEMYGARPLTRTIQHYIEDGIADEILSNRVKEGGDMKITMNKEKTEIVFNS